MSRSLLGFAAQALARRRGRTLALTVGLGLTVMLVAAVMFLSESLRAEAERGQVALPDVVVQRLVGGRPATLKADVASRFADIDSVESSRARVWGYLFLPALQGNVTVVGSAAGGTTQAPTVVGVSGGAATLEGTGALDRGRDLAPGKHEMVAGSALADALGLLPGDSFGLPSARPTAPLKLVGTFSSAVDLYTADVIVCDADDARAVLGLAPDEATDVAIDVKNQDEARVVAVTVLNRMPEARVLEKRTQARIYDLAYGRRSGLVLAACIPALIALIVLALDRASGLAPGERREIATLKAVGFSTRDVLDVKMLESLLVSSVATALGLLAAYAWIFWLGAPGLRSALVGWSVLYPHTKLTPVVDFGELLGIAGATVGPFVALSIVPAWRAAILEPMDAMRE